ncbi:MAG: SDR family oxidoreductase [Sandaracinaceae bacterium]
MAESRVLFTGATGLIGRHLVPKLLARGHHVYVLIRSERRAAHADRLAEWRAEAGGRGQLSVIEGDVTRPGLGLDADALGELDVGSLSHAFHFAALYDLDATDGALTSANVEGTRNVLGLLVDRGFSGTLHYASSVAVAGRFDGRFGEDDLDHKTGFPHEYHRSKHAAEKLVRAESRLRWRIYRPSAVVGHSRTGEMDRIDGPYYLFGAILKMRRMLPPWVTLPGLDGGAINMVPVDYVACAIDEIAHQDGQDGKGFHLADPSPPKFVDTFNLIAKAAGAPSMSRRRLGKLAKMIPGGGNVIGQLGALKFLRNEWALDFGIPPHVRDAVNKDVSYDTKNTDAALAGTDVRLPPQERYVEALWDYYLRHLDEELDPIARDRRLFGGKRVLITGASSGVGAALAERLGSAGAHVIVAARREPELNQVVERIRAGGGRADRVAVDLSELDACDRLIATVHEEHGPIDVLVNNAARSIRRPLAESLDRFHDLERVMQINYFSPARLIRGVLPSMRERGGLIINVLTAGAHMPSPKFGAYTASKAALSQLADTLAAEHLHEGVRVSNVYLHWVRTPMMGASADLEDTDAMTPEEAAAQICDGVAHRQQHVSRPTDRRRHMWSRLGPDSMARILNLVYRIDHDEPQKHPELELDRMILKRFVKGRLM